MNSVISYISDNIDNDISMQGLADALGYEYHYLSALFNQCFSMNFKKFLNIYKVEKACSLLEDGEGNIMSVYR